ncbi:MAG: cellulase family glycosylhydrolase [Treponema sp.]|nr:cellulase family glycosylhydrolase [Treponema sp.]
MKNTIHKWGGYKPFHHLRKLFILLTLICLSCSAFAQNVKPYKVDLNRLPSVNNDKTASYDRTTGMFTNKANYNLPNNGERGFYLNNDNKNINGYNIVRIKYKPLDGYGFVFTIDYDDDKLDWWLEKSYYCPSYLTEMVIPLRTEQKAIRGFYIQSVENAPSERFIIESITFEKVDNPVLTDIHGNDLPPVIDTLSSGSFNDKLSAWDFTLNLGAGINYWPFNAWDEGKDYGADIILRRWTRTRKEDIKALREKGFKTMRIQVNPCNNFCDDKYTIDPRFITELKKLVDIAIEGDMYVIIDGFFWPLQLDPKWRQDIVKYEGVVVNEEYKEPAKKILKAFWTQISAAFNNSYDEHLIFELTNEMGDALHPEHNNSPRLDCPVCKKDFAIMNEYNQLMVDTIRASGGNNAKRFIMVGGIGNGLANMCNKLFKLPKDKTKDKLIPTYHTYPIGVTDANAAKLYSNGIKKNLEDDFALLDKYYFSKHIPVYVSETGGQRATPILERINFIKDFLALCNKKGRACTTSFFLDPGLGQGAEEKDMVYYDIINHNWVDEEFINTYIYQAQGKEYPLSEEFLKKNTVIVPSIVGKNLLAEPVEIKNWDRSYRIDPELLVRSVPPKYKFEFTVESTGSNAILQVGFSDNNGNWHDLVKEKNVVVKGASIKDGWCVAISKNCTFTLSIDEKLALALEASHGLNLNGQNVIIKSVKVVE